MNDPLGARARLLSCAIEKSDMPLADFPLALDSPLTILVDVSEAD